MFSKGSFVKEMNLGPHTKVNAQGFYNVFSHVHAYMMLLSVIKLHEHIVFTQASLELVLWRTLLIRSALLANLLQVYSFFLLRATTNVCVATCLQSFLYEIGTLNLKCYKYFEF